MKEDNVSISSTLEDMLDIFSSIVVTSLFFFFLEIKYIDTLFFLYIYIY